MSVVGTHAIPDDVLDGETERLLAMVDILEPVPPEELQSLARRSAFARLDARDAAVLVAPDEYAERLCSCSARGSGAGLRGRSPGAGADGLRGRRRDARWGDGFRPPPVGAARRGLESSIICGVRPQAFEELVERNPTLGTRVTRVLGERLIETKRRLAGVVRKEVPERLASQILRLVESEGAVTREG